MTREIEITIPESLNDITLDMFQRYNELDPNMDSKALEYNMIRIFCKIDNPLTMAYTDVKDISKSIADLLNSDNDLIQRFTLGKKEIEFGFIPNLQKLSYGEFLDLEEYISNWKTYNKAMAILYRPIIKSSNTLYLIEEYNGTDEYSEIMRHAPMDVVYGSMVFFWHLGQELFNSTQNTLEHQVNELKTMRENNQISVQEDSSIKSGIKLLGLISSQMMILRNTSPSLKRNSKLASYKSSTSTKK